MEQLSLAVEVRNETGKGPARRARMAGKLPGVLYGLGKTSPITVEPKAVLKLLMEEGGRNKVLNLKGSGVDGRHAIVRDYQVDPLSRVLIHVDLLEIDVTKKIEVTVPLNFTGKSIGVADGGVLNIVNRDIQVRCIPTQIPKHIDVDVTNLKIGDAIHLDELTLAEGLEKANKTNATLVTVVPPTKEEEAVASLAPTAEPEVITEKKAEGEEGGEAKAEGGEAKKEEKEKKEKK